MIITWTVSPGDHSLSGWEGTICGSWRCYCPNYSYHIVMVAEVNYFVVAVFALLCGMLVKLYVQTQVQKSETVTVVDKSNLLYQSYSALYLATIQLREMQIRNPDIDLSQVLTALRHISEVYYPEGLERNLLLRPLTDTEKAVLHGSIPLVDVRDAEKNPAFSLFIRHSEIMLLYPSKRMPEGIYNLTFLNSGGPLDGLPDYTQLIGTAFVPPPMDSLDFDVYQFDLACNDNSLYVMASYFLKNGMVPCNNSTDMCALNNYMHIISTMYHPENMYHNQTHAADVLSVYMVLAKMLEDYLYPADVFAGFMACLSHDVDHPGLTSDFLMSLNDPLSLMYNDVSPMEMHHCGVSMRIMQTSRCSFFSEWTIEEFTYFRHEFISLVLASDMKKHADIVAKLKLLKSSAQSSEQQFQDRADRILINSLIVKLADLGMFLRPLETHKRQACQLLEEFYLQGDAQQALNHSVPPQFDRNKGIHNGSEFELAFAKLVVVPLVDILCEYVTPHNKQIVEEFFLGNIEYWRDSSIIV